MFFLGIFLGFSILQTLQSLAVAMCLAKKWIIKPKSTSNNGEDRVCDVDGSRKWTRGDMIDVRWIILFLYLHNMLIKCDYRWKQIEKEKFSKGGYMSGKYESMYFIYFIINKPLQKLNQIKQLIMLLLQSIFYYDIKSWLYLIFHPIMRYFFISNLLRSEKAKIILTSQGNNIIDFYIWWN